jgi:hypothetical protein
MNSTDLSSTPSRAYWDDGDADYYNLVEAARELNSSGLALRTTSLLANALAALARANGQSADEVLADFADR